MTLEKEDQLTSISAAFKGSAPTDAFCTKITVPYEELSLTVESVGSIRFPISARTAKSLIVEAEPARYGKGTKTLLDRQVRDTWEISQDRIKTGENWNRKLESVLKQIKKNLSLPEDGKLRAELHNLVIYMPGQFFKGHQDTEKTDGMIATLVVLLPSEFSGGTLVIDQHGDKKKFPAPCDISEKMTLIAFYADCHHEVERVIAGYRVALTYNLIFEPSSNPLPLVSNERLERELKKYFTAPEIGLPSYRSSHPRWFIYLLDHEYSQKSLSWQGLRGADRHRASELLACADRLSLEAHLALADIHETWSTEEEDWGGGYGRHGRYGRYGRYGKKSYDHSYEDEDENEGDESDTEGGSTDSEDYHLTELIDDNIELRYWIDRTGHSFPRKEHRVPQEMVCWTKAVDEFKPFKSEYEGYMGNWGNTLDRWYHRAAIVLWKKGSEFANLFVSDPSKALEKIRNVLKKNLEQGRAAIHQILPQWKGRGEWDVHLVFEIAVLVQDPNLASKLIENLGLESLTAKSTSVFLKLLESYGEKWFLSHLESWRKQRHEWNRSTFLAKDLVPLARAFSKNFRRVSSWLLEYQLAQIQEGDVDESEASPSSIKHELKKRMNLLTALLQASVAAEEPEIHRKGLQQVLKCPRLYPAIELSKLLAQLDLPEDRVPGERGGGWGFKELLAQLQDRLKEETLLTRAKEDWSVREKVPHSCSDCQKLQEFLASKTQQSLTWPLAKERRRHIHGIIDSMDIPVTHTTRHVRSPHQLILTKGQELFSRDETQVREAKEGLAEIKKFSQKLKS